ncbi:hypothetical protein [Bergeyella sp. RCAD1439]|nr:hypothetical protein [Bergeyella sp. RCAD1439]
MPNDRGDFDPKALDRKDLSGHGVRKYSEVKEELIKINPKYEKKFEDARK